MLRMLSGATHRVTTGFALVRSPQGIAAAGDVTTSVTFRTLSPEEIEGYIDTGEPFGKAGGYAIQGGASCLVREVRGSYTNVVGLPLCEVLEEIKRLGIAEPFAERG